MATQSGAQYDVTFFLAGDPFTGLVHVRAQAAGQSQDYEFDATHAWPWGMGWSPFTFSFTANSPSTTVEFYSLETGTYGPALDSIVVNGPTVSVHPITPQAFLLRAPAPNPGNGFELSYVLPRTLPVRIAVFDATGREVQELVNGVENVGEHRIRWDGRTSRGHAAAPGLYVIRLTAPTGALSRKALLRR
jgi:hypothetical protein